MSSFRRATVVRVEDGGGATQLARLRFDDGREGDAVVLESLTGSVEPGHRVIANTTAVELGLGTGGLHFVLWDLEREGLDVERDGHIMKLRYTPLQFNVDAVEEQGSRYHREFNDVAGSLEGIPVIAGTLHSQLLPVALAYRDAMPEGRLVYVMTDGAALPISISRTVAFLKEQGDLASTVTCGNAFGGDLEAVNIWSALVAARRVCRATAVVVIMGPGIVGTGTQVGFSGMEQAAILNAAACLSGTPVAIPRISFADERERHRGLSHHTVTALSIGSLARAVLAVPRMDDEKSGRVMEQIRASGINDSHEVCEVDAWPVLGLLENCGMKATTMGRGPDEEPEFFMAAGAAGFLAARMRGGDR